MILNIPLENACVYRSLKTEVTAYLLKEIGIRYKDWNFLDIENNCAIFEFLEHIDENKVLMFKLKFG